MSVNATQSQLTGNKARAYLCYGYPGQLTLAKDSLAMSLQPPSAFPSPIFPFSHFSFCIPRAKALSCAEGYSRSRAAQCRILGAGYGCTAPAEK